MRGARLLGLVALSLPLFAYGEDAGRGRLLYETHCQSCHYERVHDRLRPAVKELAELRDMVAQWAPQTKRSYSPDELASIVQYLNESHYRFGLPSAAPRR